MRTTISTKGQIVLPAEIRQQDDVLAGQQFEVERIDEGKYLITRVLPRGEPGLVDWLRSCPAHDWFENIPSESTAEL